LKKPCCRAFWEAQKAFPNSKLAAIDGSDFNIKSIKLYKTYFI
jgi:hypothetical protein